jgi:HK97 family phage prohead protease/HK97 family phage major capsid protein
MEKIFNLTSTFKTHAEEDGSIMIRGMASTVDFDRAGDSISAEAWQKGGMVNFEKNPIILFNHNYDKPIGRATGLKAGPDGLEMKAKISKHAECADLIKDGVLGAFSVGFRVKDADYIKETDGLMIKDAELFEVSVVSVPCNQSATFSLAKSFDSTEEYEEFKKTFTNRVDLAGQSLAKDEDISSSIASDTPKSAEQSATKEIKMSEDNSTGIDLEAFARKVAEETATKIAMKQAEQKAADEAQAKAVADAEAAKTLEGEKIQATIKTGVETGVEKLMADVETSMSEKEATLTDVLSKYKAELEEKQAEIAAMQQSKKSFSDRSNSGDITAFGEEFLKAKLLGEVTNKGWDTDYGRDLMEKAGVDTATVGNLNTIVSNTFVDQVSHAQQLGGLFEELVVSSGKTTLPISKVPKAAYFNSGGFTNTTDLNDDGTPGNGYTFDDVTLSAYRLIAGTSLANDLDEQLVVSLLPQLTKQLAKAHAVAIDGAILAGHGGGAIKGLVATGGSAIIASGLGGGFATGTATTGDAAAAITRRPTPENLASLRANMAAYGQNVNELAIIVAPDTYYNLIHQAGFQDISEVGESRATKLTGEIGSIFGVRVIVSDGMPAATALNVAGIMVNTSNFVRPRLGGVKFETEYSVVNQITNLVATQSVGFDQLVTDTASASIIRYPAAS